MRSFDASLIGYLLNAVWQVPIVFAAAWMSARLMRRLGPRMEHRVWAIALLLESILPACHPRISPWSLHLWGRARAAPSGETHIATSATAAYDHGLLQLPPAFLTVLTAAYTCGLLYFAGRLAWRLWKTAALQRQSTHVSLHGETARSWRRLCNTFAVPEAQLAISPSATGPITVGIRNRALLLPPQFLETVAPHDLDTVMAHEFAHMQRRDFAKNLLFEVLALPIAFHPFLWLTRSHLAESREMICDAMAADATAGKDSYAKSLLRLASMLTDQTPATNLHAIGIFGANIFERRVMNLTQKRTELKGARRFAAATACVFLALATCASALALRLNIADPNPSTTAQKTDPTADKKDFTPPKLISSKPPVYPANAKAEKDTLNGPVVLSVIVGTDGIPQSIRINKSLRRDYDISAIEAVQQYRFTPAKRAGVPVVAETHVEINYIIK